MPKILGIDLGTTNSVVAVIEGGEAVVIPNAEGERVTPSVVAVSKSGERLVGQVARRQAVMNPNHTIFSIKRFMGRKINEPEIQADREMVPYQLAAAPNNDVRVLMGGREYAPPEISAMILQKLKVDAEAYLGEEVSRAVITVPAYFNDSQRQSTKDAGRIAGLEVLRIINEPTASALAYGLQRAEQNQIIAVYDLGGGTFDISILELTDQVVEVRATSGDTHLGGDDFDRCIIDWLAEAFAQEHQIDLRDDRTALQRLKEAAEKAKMELSTLLRSEINLPFITADAEGPKHLSITLTRARLEQLTADLIERSMIPVRQALDDAGLRPDQIDAVLLVGGQTRMPAVQEVVRTFFGREPGKSVNPDEVVAMGAAIQAGILGGEVKDLLLLDVTPLTLGIETLGGVMTPLIERNTTIPTTRERTFSTVTDKQNSVEIHVLQGERIDARHNKSLGRFELSGLAPTPRGQTQIEVLFDIDANGITRVSARDKATGKEQRIVITPSSGLTKEEIERMIEDAREHREDDQRKQELVHAQNAADSAIYVAERVIRESGDDIEGETRGQLDQHILTLRMVQDGEDLSAITEKTMELSRIIEQAHKQLAGKRTKQNGDSAPPPGESKPADANADANRDGVSGDDANDTSDASEESQRKKSETGK